MRVLGILFLGLTLACSTPKSDQQSFSVAQRDSLFLEDAASSKENEFNGTDLEKSLQEQGLLDIQKEIPGIEVELKYSTEANFFKQDVRGFDPLLPTACSCSHASESPKGIAGGVPQLKSVGL